jgi:nitrous oxidase accessory protein
MRWVSIVLLFGVFSCAVFAKGNTLVVGKQMNYATIKSAMLAAEAGDTILVKSGFYKEGNILIVKPLTFIGEGFPVIDGDRRFEVITIKASNVIISGFKIQHSGFATLDDPGGVKIINASNITISDNILYDNFFGVYIQQGHNCIVKNNLIVAFNKDEQQIGNGIHCWKSDSLQIIGNDISGHRDGIYFEFVTHSVIWRNISHDNIRYGLHFMFSNDDSYFTNIFKKNGAGVAVMFTKNVTMMNNHFEENWGDAAYGLLLKEISDSYISGNTFGTNRIKLERNVFEQNGWAIQIQASCMDNILSNNDFLSNTFDISTNGTNVLNTFANNYWDKYTGYDLNHDGIGDVPFHPLSMYCVVVENIPSAMLLYRSFFVTMLDKSEKMFPSITPDNFIDKTPRIKSIIL